MAVSSCVSAPFLPLLNVSGAPQSDGDTRQAPFVAGRLVDLPPSPVVKFYTDCSRLSNDMRSWQSPREYQTTHSSATTAWSYVSVCIPTAVTVMLLRLG